MRYSHRIRGSWGADPQAARSRAQGTHLLLSYAHLCVYPGYSITTRDMEECELPELFLRWKRKPCGKRGKSCNPGFTCSCRKQTGKLGPGLVLRGTSDLPISPHLNPHPLPSITFLYLQSFRNFRSQIVGPHHPPLCSP